MGNMAAIIYKAVKNSRAYKFESYDIGRNGDVFWVNHYGKTILSLNLNTGQATTAGESHSDQMTIGRALKVLGFNPPPISKKLMNRQVSFGFSQNKWW